MDTKENNGAEVLDRRVLGEICAVPGRFDDPMLARLIALFLREETPRLAELKQLAEQQLQAELGCSAHKMAGSCAVIGAAQMLAAAQRLELLAKAGAWDKVPSHLAAMQGAWSRLQAELKKVTGTS